MSDEKKPFDPVDSFTSLRDNLRKAVEAGVKSVTQTGFPPVDVYQSDGHVVVQTGPIDGLDATTIEVSMTGYELTISGATRSTSDIPTDSYLLRERNFGQFTRTITIPVKVKASEAKAKVKKNSALTISFPIEQKDNSDVIDVQVTDT